MNLENQIFQISHLLQKVDADFSETTELIQALKNLDQLTPVT